MADTRKTETRKRDWKVQTEYGVKTRGVRRLVKIPDHGKGGSDSVDV